MVTAALLFLLAILTGRPVEGPFQDLTFDQALAAAKRDNKVVMIDYFTTWCGPCKKLDATTWKDPAVVAWLGEKTIALKIDAEKEAELARKHVITGYPTMLFLKPDGSVIDRIVGYKAPTVFLSQAKDALAGKTGVARATEKLVGHEKDPMARGEHARELAEAGRYGEALAEYLWCFDDEGVKASPFYTGVRVSFLLSDIERLGRRHPPAIKALEDRRDAAETRLLEGSDSDDDVRDAVALNRTLKSPLRSLALFDRMRTVKPLSAGMRRSFSHELLQPLVEARRYRDALDLYDTPGGYVTWKIEQARSRPRFDEGQNEEVRKAMESAAVYLRNALVTECGRMYEALLGDDEADAAAKVAADVIEFAPSGATYSTLIDSAVRAGTLDAARSMGEKGLEALPEAEKNKVREALGRIPATK